MTKLVLLNRLVHCFDKNSFNVFGIRMCIHWNSTRQKI